MAKGLYNLKFTSNFSFKKLSDNFPKVMSKTNNSILRYFATDTKERITDGNLRGLSQNTLELRRRGLSTFDSYDGDPGTSQSTRPLDYTGNLLKSIKAVGGEGLEMLEYGLEHHRGFTTPEGNFVHSRKFISGLEEDKQHKYISEDISIDLHNRMNKALKR